MDILRLFKNPEDHQAFKAGDVVFSKGDPARHMYVVLAGEVEVKLGDTHLDTLGPGSLLGEMALVGDHVRSATAVARTDCTLAVVNERRFIFLVQETPFFALHVMGAMADRIRRADALAH